VVDKQRRVYTCLQLSIQPPECLESHEIVRSLNTGFKHYSDSSQTFNTPDIYLDTPVVDKQRRVYTCLQLFLTLTPNGAFFYR